jgi:hypothetical protein
VITQYEGLEFQRLPEPREGPACIPISISVSIYLASIQGRDMQRCRVSLCQALSFQGGRCRSQSQLRRL